MQFEKHPNTCNRVTPLNITTPREAPFQLPGGGGAGLGRREARKLGARTSARHMYNINYYTYVYVQCHVPVGSGSDVGTDQNLAPNLIEGRFNNQILMPRGT